ncbi:putative Zinc metalloproteinase nas-7 [Hypsibius exemplaris]|uniref:Metalloendopeptidase n=1 Tax=Hypsibius exemplaris TaxID=2072580 RepID=A0A9X6NNL7_HYPEX|nr:putative Zinc metalloproteinase nas-7 [Hypsibius exemplaris]
MTPSWRRYALNASLILTLFSGTSAGNPSMRKRVMYHQDWPTLIEQHVYDYSRLKTNKSSRSHLLEGDILTPNWSSSGERFNPNDKDFPQNGAESKLWEGGIVPYVIAAGLSYFNEEQQMLIQRSLEQMQAKTCLQFVPPKDGEPHIVFVPGNDGCSSSVGRTGDLQQVIYLDESCLTLVGEVQHQVMHAIGFRHEQSRMDRDEYVDIIWQNIPPDLKNLFKTYHGRTLELPYDYNSIMHYAHNEFSTNPDALPTILPKSVAAIGNREKLSEIDIKRINALYPCNRGRIGNQKHVPVESSTQLNKKTTAIEAVSPDDVAVEDNRLTPVIPKHQPGTTTVEPFLRNLKECPTHLKGLALSQCVTDSQCKTKELGSSCCQQCVKSVCNTYCTDKQAGPTTGEVATTMMVDKNLAGTLPSRPVTDNYTPDTSTLRGHGPSTENKTATIGNLTFYPVFVAQSVPDYFCYFYTNLTYTCKTSCEASGGELKLANFTSGGKKVYYDMDCAAEVLLSSEKRWGIGPNSLVPKKFKTDVDSEILATCAFYHSMDFDCNGVTDCMEAKNENRCGSAAPWSGRFSGSPEEGLKLNGTIIKTGSDAG